MVTYGPWIQDPNFNGSPAASFHINQAKAVTETDYQDPPRIVEAADLVLAATNTDSAARAGVENPAFFNEWGMAYSWSYQLSVGLGWKTGWVAASAKRTLTFGPGQYIYRPDDYGLHDPTAIGIDWIDQPYDPEDPFAGDGGEQVALTLLKTTRVSGWWDDTTTPGNTELSTAGSVPVTRLVVEDPTGFEALLMDVPPPEVTGGLAEAYLSEFTADHIDLTPHVIGHGWVGKLKMHVQPTYYEPKGDLAELGGGGLVRYGWGFDNIQFFATCRPPLYRWVYEGTPYRRNLPRDDALAGGAGRNFPSSKAMQSGRRTSGGYL